VHASNLISERLKHNLLGRTSYAKPKNKLSIFDASLPASPVPSISLLEENRLVHRVLRHCRVVLAVGDGGVRRCLSKRQALEPSMPRRGGLREILLAVRESALALNVDETTRATIRVEFGWIRDVTEIVSRSPVAPATSSGKSRSRRACVALVHAPRSVFLCSVCARARAACRVGAPLLLVCMCVCTCARALSRGRAFSALARCATILSRAFNVHYHRACVPVRVCRCDNCVYALFLALLLQVDVVVVCGVVLHGIYGCRADAAAPLRM